MWLIALLVCLIVSFYIYVKQCHSYYAKRGIPTKKPVFFFGHLLDVFLARKGFDKIVLEHYNAMKDAKYIGFYNMLQPTVMVCDPELLGDVMVKDFQHFANNNIEIQEDVDYMMSKNIFVLKGHHWKSMRSLISPMFSSGKLKFIFPLVAEVSQTMENYMKKEIDAGRGVCVDGKNLTTKFTTDNVASCAFGLNGGAFDGDTKFASVASSFADNSYLNSMKLFFIFLFPSLNKIFKMQMFKTEVEEYLTGIIANTLKYRRDNNQVRNDFLDHISSLKGKSTEYPFSDRDVIAQAAGFFIDGVETSSGVMAYVLYEIARNPEVQRKIREEIKKVKAAHGNKITYEAVNEMDYLDGTIHESLRLNGPATALSKVCTKTYTFPEVSDTNKSRLVLNPGDIIQIGVEGIHRDPQYFPDPLAFKPERFMAENKENIQKHTYLPFGNGPRFCIGMRFGLLQIKMAVVTLIENFHIDINEKMLPYEVHPLAVIRAPKRGFWFDFKNL